MSNSEGFNRINSAIASQSATTRAIRTPKYNPNKSDSNYTPF